MISYIIRFQCNLIEIQPGEDDEPEIEISRSDDEVDPVTAPATTQSSTNVLSPKNKKFFVFFIRIRPGLISVGFGRKKRPILVLRDEDIEELPYIDFGGDGETPSQFIFEKDSLVTPEGEHSLKELIIFIVRN